MIEVPLVPITAVAALVLYGQIRRIWFNWNAEVYSTLATFYASSTNVSDQVAADMSVVWPWADVLLRFWVWDFRAFIADHESYDRMVKWVRPQLMRNDLDLETYMRETAARVPTPPVAPAPADTTEPQPPTS